MAGPLEGVRALIPAFAAGGQDAVGMGKGINPFKGLDTFEQKGLRAKEAFLLRSCCNTGTKGMPQ